MGFEVQEPKPEENESLIARFQTDRGREYGEFAQRCGGFLAEIEKETKKRKFTFAEFEEIEDDFEKLTAWLKKIHARDFFPDERSQTARETLEHCEAALKAFAESVYTYEGVAVMGDETERVKKPS